MKRPPIAEELDRSYRAFCRSSRLVDDFIACDPVQFPRRYTNQADIEIAAFLSATIAWGRREQIIISAEKMFAMMPHGPLNFVMSSKPSKNARPSCIHRTFFEHDLRYFCKGFKHCYQKYGNLETLFAASPDMWQGIALFREEMALANGGRYSKHIANADKSACKRINLALRWLVRQGRVDLGLWKNVRPSSLCIPLDVHVARNARSLGLLQRASNDRKAVEELTGKLKEFCPEDPVKYDFALFGMS